MGKWPSERVWRWYEGLPWLCGFNYLPRTAVNFIEMWRAETFDPATIEQELAWGRDSGFNSLRTCLPFTVWRHDRQGLMERLDRFLDLCRRCRLSVMLSPLDDCGFSGEHPTFGPQPDPEPAVHNGRAMASPGRDAVMDKDRWPEIEAYVREVVAAHRADERVLVWDLYNEPGNTVIFRADGVHQFTGALEPFSMELMREVFAWAREIDPIQPLTTGGWHLPAHWEEGEVHRHPIDLEAFELSDVVSFHAYCTAERMHSAIQALRRYGRPLLCTEWMGRHAESRIEEQLPMFHRERIGCYKWGLVKGRTQTYVPWPDLMARAEAWDEATGEWFHDLLAADGTPHRPHEVALIRRLTGAARPQEDAP